jgi:flagellar hook-associated protein 2
MGVFNISGLSSGIDTEEIVGKLLEVEKKPLLNLQVEHKIINAKLPIIQDVNFKLIGLKTMMKDLTYETPFATKKISSSVSSSVSAVISGKNAVDGNYVIDSVSKIATASITRSQATVGGSIDINEKISSAIKKPVYTGTFSINSYSFGVNSALDSMQSVINNINSQTVNTGVEAAYDSLNDNLILKNAVSGNKNTIVLGSPEDTSNFLSVVGLSGAFQDTGSEVSSTTIKSIGHLGAVDSSKLLSETNFDRAFIAGNIKINGVEINVFASDTLNALITRINNSNANVTANYDTATDKFNLSSKNSGASYIKIEEVAGGSNFLELTGLIGLKSSTSISQTSGSVGLTSFLNDANLKTALVPGTLQIAHGGNTYTINYDETKTFQNLVDDINALDPNISASYDAGSGKFYIKPSSNSSPNITLTDLSGNLKSVLNFGGAGDNQSIGENAEYKINGITYKSNSNVINDKFNDISFTLTGVSSTSITLNVSNDATVAKKNIEKFVELYNELITELDKQLKDEKSPVFRDNTLKDVFDGLKKFINRYVANGTNYSGLSDIGITTGAAGMVFNDDYIGKLEIDTSKLDSILESNPGDIRKLFAYDPDGGNKLTDGIAYHFNNYLESLTKVDGTINKVIGVTNRELMRIAGNIIDWNDRVKIIESGLRTKFNSMEVLLGQVKRQGESLSQSLSKLS